MREDAHAEATEAFAAMRYRRVVDLCNAALDDQPSDPDAEYLLARTMIEAGSAPLASMMLARLAMLRPDDAEVHASHSRALRLSGDGAQAADALERALEIDPTSLTALLEQADSDASCAVEATQKAVKHHPCEPAAYFALAGALVSEGRVDQARDAYRRSVELDARFATRHHDLASVRRGRDDGEGALRILAEGRRLAPDDPVMAHQHAAVGGGEAPARASDDYLVQHFDHFAGYFEDRLGDLGYSVPERLSELAAARLDSHDAALDVLDAGCGTGLAAPLLRPLASRLVGVDISPGMLERARERGMYDDVVTAELTSYLERARGAFDLVFCADVLIYFGDLARVVRLLAGALRPGGCLAFSVERTDEAAHVLTHSGRYAHSAAHVEEAVRAAGLTPELHEHALRQEFGKPVAGLLAIAG